MFCPKCGAKNEDGAKFCGACGAPIPQPASAPAPDAQPAGAPAPGQVPGPVPGPVPGSAPTPSPIASGASQLGSLAGNIGGILPLARIIAGAVLVIAFFLPFYSIYGIFDMSPMQMTFGVDFYGSHIDGEIRNLYYLIPGIGTLIAAFVYKNKQGDIATLAAGVLGLIFLFITLEDGVSLAFGGWLYVLASIVCIAIGALQLIANRK